MENVSNHDMCFNTEGNRLYVWSTNLDNEQELWEYNIPEDTWKMIPFPVPVNKPGLKLFYRQMDETVNFLLREGADVQLWSFFLKNESWMDRSISQAEFSVYKYGKYYDQNSDRLFLLGGGVDEKNKEFHILDLEDLIVTKIFSSGYPSNDGDNYFFERSGELYHFNSPYQRDLHSFDRVKGVWSDPIPIEGDPLFHNYDPGVCYDPINEAFFIIGGGSYHSTLGRFQRVSLSNFTSELISETTILGDLAGCSLVYNPNDEMMYGFGSYVALGGGAVRTNSTFFQLDPKDHSIQIIEHEGPYPVPRWGVTMVMDPMENEFYVFAGANETEVKNDLWKYDIDSGNWLMIHDTGEETLKPLGRIRGRMVLDEMLREFILIGGVDNPNPSAGFNFFVEDQWKYKISEGTWERLITKNQMRKTASAAVYFDQYERDLWVYGRSDITKNSVWKIDLDNPKVIDLSMKDPTIGDNIALSMYDTYELGLEILFTKEPYALDSAVIKIPSKNGYVFLNYSGSTREFSEYDPLDLFTLESQSENWNDNVLELSLSIKFNWSFSSPNEGNSIYAEILPKDRPLIILFGTNVFIVKNDLDAKWEGGLTSSYRGMFEDGWISGREEITINDIEIKYNGTDIEPIHDTYGIRLLREDLVVYSSPKGLPSPFDISFNTSNIPEGESQYHLELTGIPEDLYSSEVSFSLKMDAENPTPPKTFEVYPDELNGTMNSYDNDREMFLKWLGASDNGSGISYYLWSFEEGGGTIDGTR
jgi:hypothetical protein